MNRNQPHKLFAPYTRFYHICSSFMRIHLENKLEDQNDTHLHIWVFTQYISDINKRLLLGWDTLKNIKNQN